MCDELFRSFSMGYRNTFKYIDSPDIILSMLVKRLVSINLWKIRQHYQLFRFLSGMLQTMGELVITTSKSKYIWLLSTCLWRKGILSFIYKDLFVLFNEYLMNGSDLLVSNKPHLSNYLCNVRIL